MRVLNPRRQGPPCLDEQLAIIMENGHTLKIELRPCITDESGNVLWESSASTEMRSFYDFSSRKGIEEFINDLEKKGDYLRENGIRSLLEAISKLVSTDSCAPLLDPNRGSRRKGGRSFQVDILHGRFHVDIPDVTIEKEGIEDNTRFFSTGMDKAMVFSGISQSFRDGARSLNLCLGRTEKANLNYNTIRIRNEALGLQAIEALYSDSLNILSENGFEIVNGLPARTEEYKGHIYKPTELKPEENEFVHKTIELLNSSSEYNCALMLSSKYPNRNEDKEQMAAFEEELAIELSNRLINPNLDINIFGNAGEPVVKIHIDAVQSPIQVDNKEGEPMDAKNVMNYVCVVEFDGTSIRLVMPSLDQLFVVLVACLCENNILYDHKMVFFTDGAEDLRIRIEKVFNFRPIEFYLDWYHYVKKVFEILSMAIGGGKLQKKAEKSKIAAMMWSGRNDKVMSYLKSAMTPEEIDAFKRDLTSGKIHLSDKCMKFDDIEVHEHGLDRKLVKNAAELRKLIAYLMRKNAYIPCYALRKFLGLCNSSSRVEQTNNTIVSKRQKGKGMSWSRSNSHAQAALSMLVTNNDIDNFLSTGHVSLKLKSPEQLVSDQLVSDLAA